MAHVVPLTTLMRWVPRRRRRLVILRRRRLRRDWSKRCQGSEDSAGVKVRQDLRDDFEHAIGRIRPCKPFVWLEDPRPVPAGLIPAVLQATVLKVRRHLGHAAVIAGSFGRMF